MTDRRGRRAGVSLLGTADDQDEAVDWQQRLVAAGIQSILRGHRESGSTERRPAFAGVDVYVPSTQLARSREVISPVAATGQVLMEDGRPFPWTWLFAVPVVALVAVAIVVVVVL